MNGSADTNLVLALINADDALHERARRHVATAGRLRMPLSVGIELLQVARKKDLPALELLGHAARDFDVDQLDLLAIAAKSMARGEVTSPMDAVHLADAFLHGTPLHTADRKLQKTAFPTMAW